MSHGIGGQGSAPTHNAHNSDQDAVGVFEDGPSQSREQQVGLLLQRKNRAETYQEAMKTVVITTPLDKEFRHRLATVRKAGKPLAPAQNLKAPEGGTRLKDDVVPRCHRNEIARRLISRIGGP